MFESVNNHSCAVIGKPIKHSLSPQIHQHFAHQFDLVIDYQRLSCEPTDFEQVVTSFFAAGGRGMNVTTPFKEQAYDLASSVCEESRIAHSCNTLFMKDGLLTGTTTDGSGWLLDIHRLGISLAGSRVLLLGVGGASRIILQRLLGLTTTEAPNQIVLANRTVGKLTPLLTDERIIGVSLEDIPRQSYDLIINGLPIGWQDSFPDIDPEITRQAYGYDLNYGAGSEPFKRWFIQSEEANSRCYDGWGMLVNQAALSFEIWWQKEPATQLLIDAGPQSLQESST